MGSISLINDADVVAARFIATLNKQIAFAASRALNKTAVDVIKAERQTMAEVFDRPTPWTLNAFRYEPATKDTLTAVVERRLDAKRRDYLATEAKGGQRGQTALEGLLANRITYGGILAAIVPGDGAKLNQYGNWDAGERNTVVSVLKAMRDGAANETARSRKRAGAKRARYFVPKVGTIKTPGIWRRTPGKRAPDLIALFLPAPPAYQPRFPFLEVGTRTAVDVMPGHFEREMAAALATARW